MNPSPKISVIVPNYNYAKYLEERIESILAQTFQDFELIIIDDGSTDGSTEKIEKYRSSTKVSHIVYNKTNSGSPFIQWMHGISLARGEWIWIAESDDVANEDFLSSLIAQADNRPDAVIAYCHSYLIDSDGNLFPKDWHTGSTGGGTTVNQVIIHSSKEFSRKMLKANYIYNASMAVFRRSVVGKLPETYSRYKAAGDWAFWMSVCLQGQVVEVCKKLNSHRLHENSATSNSIRTGIDLEEVACILNDFIGQLKLNSLQRFYCRGRWTLWFRHADYAQSRKERIAKDYPDVFGATGFNLFCIKLYFYLQRRVSGPWI